MIRRTFTFESDSQPCPASHDRLAARLNVCIAVSCRDSDGADATFEFESITNSDIGDADVELSSLPDAERGALERLAQAVADEVAPEAFQEYCEGRADWEYDRMRDDAMEDSGGGGTP